MINALQNQADFAISKVATTRPAQNSPGTDAVSALNQVMAKAAPSQDELLETQARNLIGTTFYATLLKQMHDSPFKSELFSGGRGGEAFGGLYDQHLAQHMAQAQGNKLTRAIVNKYAATKKYEEQQKKPAAETFKQEADHVPHDRRA